MGSLISIDIGFSSVINIVPEVNMTLCTFSNNYMVGASSSLIYIHNAIITVSQSTFSNNGFLGYGSKSNTIDDNTAPAPYFIFEDYIYDY